MLHNETLQKSSEVPPVGSNGSLCSSDVDCYRFVFAASGKTAQRVNVHYQASHKVDSMAVERAFDVLFGKMFRAGHMCTTSGNYEHI